MFKAKPAYIARRLRERITDAFNENYVITFPRSGRNWTRNMVTDCGVPNFKEKVFDIDTLFTEISTKKKIIFGHDIADYPFIQELRADNPALHFRPERYKGKKIFLITRNPVDIAISHYHWLGFNENLGEPVGYYPKDIDDFVLSPDFGAARISAFHKHWIKFLTETNIVKDYVIYSYEDMKQDTEKYLKTMFDFFGFDVSPETIKRAVEKNAAEKAKQDKNRETRAGQKLSIHGPEKISDETREKLDKILAA